MIRITFYLLLTAMMTGIFCSKDKGEDIGEHVMPWGFALYDSGVEVGRYFKGEFSANSGISISEGSQSGHISVWFLDQDSMEFNPQTTSSLNDAHHELELTVRDTSLASIFRHDQSNGEDWGFHVVGKSQGLTGLHIALVHEDHYGFIMPDSVWLPITVTEPQQGPPLPLLDKIDINNG